MKVRLVAHASVIIEAAAQRIWTDPWLFGKAFNESWSLFPSPEFQASLVDNVDYLWISHEHPDHFHIPTLKSLPPAFKERVTVLYQENNSDKIFAALKRLGFRQFKALPHRQLVSLSDELRVYCYQVGQMDSALAIRNGSHTLLNANDCELNSKDCRMILRDVDCVDVVLNQFSIAGYNGLVERQKYLPQSAKRVLESVTANHRDLRATLTIPIASFIYFSTVDNRYVNQFANTPRDVVDHLARQQQDVVVLYPGDEYEVGSRVDSTPALERYDALYATLSGMPYDETTKVPIADILNAFQRLANSLHERYPKAILALLRPVTVRIPDLETTIRFSIPARTLENTDLPAEQADLIVNSQPLCFAFSHPFGIQTLGVSARFSIQRNFRNWKWHRIVFSLNNAEVYLRFKYLLTRKNLAWFRKRFRGSMQQLVYHLQRM